MALKNFAIVCGQPPLEGGVLVEFWDDTVRCTAHIQRAGLDDMFDHLLGYRKPGVPLSAWNQLVQENLAAFERIVEAKYRATEASLGKPVLSFEIDLNDIQSSGEKLTRDALLDEGIASRKSGTQRPSRP